MFYTNMWSNKNQLPALSFCVPHSKPHGPRRLSKHYQLCSDTKLGNVVYDICHIPCACVACASMLDKP